MSAVLLSDPQRTLTRSEQASLRVLADLLRRGALPELWKAVDDAHGPRLAPHLEAYQELLQFLAEAEAGRLFGPKAVAWARRLIRSLPPSFHLELALARLLVRHGDFPAARRACSKASRLLRSLPVVSAAATRASVYQIRGELERDAGSATLAERHFRDALATAQAVGAVDLEMKIRSNLAGVLFDAGRLDDARREWDTASRHFGVHDPTLRYHLAILALAEGDDREALRALRRLASECLRLGADAPVELTSRGRLATLLCQVEAEQGHLKWAELARNFARCLEGRASIGQMTERAKRWLHETAELFPHAEATDRVALARAEASLWARQGEWSEAESVLTRVLEQSLPRPAEALLTGDLAELVFRQQRFVDAVPVLRRELELAERMAPTNERRLHALVRLSQCERRGAGQLTNEEAARLRGLRDSQLKTHRLWKELDADEDAERAGS